MKRRRDNVAGLDVHRDRPVAATRIVGADQVVGAINASFITTAKGWGELAQGVLASGPAPSPRRRPGGPR